MFQLFIAIGSLLFPVGIIAWFAIFLRECIR